MSVKCERSVCWMLPKAMCCGNLWRRMSTLIYLFQLFLKPVSAVIRSPGSDIDVFMLFKTHACFVLFNKTGMWDRNKTHLLFIKHAFNLENVHAIYRTSAQNTKRAHCNEMGALNTNKTHMQTCFSPASCSSGPCLNSSYFLGRGCRVLILVPLPASIVQKSGMVFGGLKLLETLLIRTPIISYYLEQP